MSRHVGELGKEQGECNLEGEIPNLSSFITIFSNLVFPLSRLFKCHNMCCSILT